jgi:predicted RNA binding protein YcfA (HicA-like mRNA interferase family)
MPKKIRELKAMLVRAGFELVAGGGKGSHSKWRHPSLPRFILLSGNDGDDARRYHERKVEQAIQESRMGRRSH